MKIWTTQKDLVIEQIINNEKYEPDFSKSDGLASDEMKAIYAPLLQVYKKRNGVDCRGLVFAVSKLNDMQIDTINDYNDYFYQNPTFSDSISQYGENYTILELNVDDSLNMIPINFQDFMIIGKRFLRCDDYLCFIKPALQNILYSTFEFDLKIAQSNGWMNDDIDDDGIPYLYKITQAHIHKIELSDIIGVYPTIDYNEGVKYSLSKSAKKLMNRIIK